MNYRFSDLVDIEQFHSLLQSLYEATGILHGLIDTDNQIISSAGWQKVCTDFHRATPRTLERCQQSNCALADSVVEGQYCGCACTNGLFDYATPIIVEGRSLATLHFGQVLHEPPDLEFFRKQAQQMGFDEEEYLTAIRAVPIIERERIKPIMNFYVQLAQMLAGNGLNRLKQRDTEKRLADLNENLSRHVARRTAELTETNRQLLAEIEERERTADALRDSRIQLQAILDSSPIGIGWSNVNGQIEYINERFIDLFGYNLTDIPTIEHWYRLAYPDENYRNQVVAKWVQETAEARSKGLKPPQLEASVTCKDGSIRRVDMIVNWVGNRRLVSFHDITDRWRAEQHDQARKSTLELIATGASLPHILLDIVHNLEAENPGMLCSILLLDRDGQHLIHGAAPSLPEFYNEAINGISTGVGVGSCGSAVATRKRVIVENIQTHPYWAPYKELAASAKLAACWSEPILSSKGRILGTFGIYHHHPQAPSERDLELIESAANLAAIAIEHSQTEAELERQAHTDFLTEIANRRHFMALAEVELARAVRYGSALTLLMLDIDYFKAINDRFGHDTGDQVLKQVAGILRQTLREADQVGRLGGEEFAAVLPETACEEGKQIAERLRIAVSAANLANKDDIPVRATISIGVATLKHGPENLNVLLKRADQALYAAKKHGRNQVQAADCSAASNANYPAGLVKLSWNNTYKTNNELIDHQHETLFQLANDLLAAAIAKTPSPQAAAILNDLVATLQQHFHDEETVLAQIGFPNLEHHASCHKRLSELTLQRVAAFRRGELGTSELFGFLVHELIAKHMLIEDQEFLPYLKNPSPIES